MSVIPASVKCDGCGKDRAADNNHWRSFKVTRFNPELGRYVTLEIQSVTDACLSYHACGETCALKLVSRWLSTGSLEEK